MLYMYLLIIDLLELFEIRCDEDMERIGNFSTYEEEFKAGRLNKKS